MLYGLVHQRYILTRVGLQAMVRSNPIISHAQEETQVVAARKV